MTDWAGIATVVGALTVLVGAITTAALTIIKALRDGQTQNAASSAIAAEQKNRELVTRGAEPVTALSPPMGTGNGRVDAAVTTQLAAAPTSPTTASAPPTTPLP